MPFLKLMTVPRRSARLLGISTCDNILSSATTDNEWSKPKILKRKMYTNSKIIKAHSSSRNEHGDFVSNQILVAVENNKKAASLMPSKKILPSRQLEETLWREGFQFIAGVDEAGRGPLAGPVVAAACIIPADIFIEGIDDSKKLSEAKRNTLFDSITSAKGVSYAICAVEADEIDKVNILQATMKAMARSVELLSSPSTQGTQCRPDYILVDGNRVPDSLKTYQSQCVVGGDRKSYVIAAASILAKVTRDRLMLQYHEKWPEYGFKANKGYGTAIHLAAIRLHGPCQIHRHSFAPMKDMK